MNRLRRVGIFGITGLVLVCCLPGSIRAQAPSISAVSPQAVTPGETVDLTIRGGNLSDAAHLWTSFPAETGLSPDVQENGQKDNRSVFRVTVPGDARVGIHGIRIAGPGGVSKLRLIAVDDLPSVAQAGNNTSPQSAQSLQWPVAVDGTIAPLQRRYFSFQAQKGQRISFEVLARRMGSALDPMIRILDTRGRELTYSDDEPGLSTDSRLCYTFPEAGEYLLELRDIRFQGGGNHFFRLRVGDFPCIDVPYPLGVQRGNEVALSFAGPDVDDVPAISFQAPEEAPGEWVTVGAKRDGGQSSGLALLAVGDDPEAVDAEPNNKPDQAQGIELGTNVNGRFDKSGDVDRFTLSATKGQRYRFEGITRRQGSASDLVLRLLDSEGKQLARSDDTGDYDAAFTQTFPADGDYTLVVRELLKRNGNRFVYRIAISEAPKGFALSVDAERLNIPAGGTAAVTVTANRDGYGGPIQVAAVDLPKGVTSVPSVIGRGQNRVVLTLRGTAEAQSDRSFPIRIVGTAKAGQAEFQAQATVTGALRQSFNGMIFPPPHLNEALAMAVGPQPPFALRTEPARVAFGPQLKATVQVVAERTEGYDGAIELAVRPEENGLPDGIEAQLKPIPEGKNRVEIAFTANEKARLGEFTAVLQGTHKKDDKTASQFAPGVGLKLDEPLQLSADFGEAKLKKGGELAVEVKFDKNPALSAPVDVSVENLPEGVSIKRIGLTGEPNRVRIILAAAKDAQAGQVKDVKIRGRATVGDKTLSATSTPVTLTVE